MQFQRNTYWPSLLTFLAFWALVTNLQAQTYSYRQYTTADELPHDNVFKVVQDARGFLWVGTELGLARFNGREFTQKELSVQLPGPVVSDMLLTDDSLLVAGCYRKGIALLSLKALAPRVQQAIPTSFRDGFYQKANQLWSIQQQMHWAGDSLVLDRYFDSRVVELKDPAHPRTTILAMAPLPEPGRWLVGTPRGLYIYNGDRAKFNMVKRVSPVPVHSIVPEGNGFWVGGLNSLAYFTEDLVAVDSVTGIKGWVERMAFTPSGELWFSTRVEGLYKVVGGKAVDITPALGLEGTNITCLYQDREGNIWIGTYGKGLLRVDPSSAMETYTEAYGLGNNYVESLEYDKYQDVVWAGTFDGLNALHKGQLYHLSEGVPGNGQNLIRDIKATPTGTWACLDLRDAKAHIPRTSPWGLPLHFVDAATSLPMADTLLLGQYTSSSVKWLPTHYFTDGTLSGAGSYVGLRFWEFKNLMTPANIAIAKEIQVKALMLDSLTRGRPHEIFYDSLDNCLWVCKASGLFRAPFNGSTQQAEAVSGLQGVSVFDIKRASPEHVWVGSEKGLMLYEEGRLKAYPLPYEMEGVRHVSGLELDTTGSLWVSTYGGLFELRADSTMRHLTYADGLATNTLHDVAYVPNQHSVYVGSSQGLTHIWLDRLAQASVKSPSTFITALRTTDTLWVPHAKKEAFLLGQRSFSLEFATPHYRLPHAVHYRYKLANAQDAAWSYSNLPSVNFSNLAPGRYTFAVQAAVLGGDWGPESSLLLRVPYPYWQRWWVMGPGLLVVAMGFWVLVRRRVRRARLQEREKHATAQQMAMLRHQALGAMLHPHFIFNALNSIQNYMNQHRSEQANDYLVKFARLIRMNLEMAEKDLVPLSEELDRLNLYVALERMRLSIPLEYKVVLEEGLDASRVLIPGMLIQPYVENALWHGFHQQQEHGALTLSLNMEEGSLHIELKDNGIGINQSLAQKGEGGHQSKGMNLTQERLRYVQTLTGKEPRLSVAEWAMPNGHTGGTRVNIMLPLLLR